MKNKPQKGCTKCQTLTDQHQLVEGTGKEAVEADTPQPLCCVQTSLHLGQHRMCTQPMKAEPIPRQLKAQGQECILWMLMNSSTYHILLCNNAAA